MVSSDELEHVVRPWWVYVLWSLLILLFVGAYLIRGMIFSSPKESSISQNNVSRDKIDLSDQLASCIYFRDHIECTLISGITYFAMLDKITAVTTWDCSAWKENPC